MSNIDKRSVQAVADLKAGYTLGHADVEIIQQMALDAVTLLDELEDVQKTSAARLGAIDTTHKMFQRERDRAEAAEKRIAELSQKADIYDMLRQDYALQGSLVDFVDWQAKRIAELESREVKLPELCVGVVQGGHAVMVPYAAGHWFNKTAILEMLADAGINIAAAGKGE